jgi:phage tail protein X
MYGKDAEVEITAALDVSPALADWSQHLVDKGAIEKPKKPAGCPRQAVQLVE